MEFSDPIVNGALKDLANTAINIDQAERMIRILSEAGEDTTKQRAALQALKGRRLKLITALKNNGANMG